MRDQLHSENRKTYKHYGELHIAETPEQAGLLIYNFNDGRRRTFYFNHNYRLYWFNLDMDKYSKELERIEADPDRDFLLDSQNVNSPFSSVRLFQKYVIASSPHCISNETK